MQLFDTHARKKILIEQDEYENRFFCPWPELGGELVTFELYADKFKPYAVDQLTLAGYHIVQNAGWVVGVRTQMRPPGGIYTNTALFAISNFKDWIGKYAPPEELPPHPLIYVIPQGQIGAGVILVRNTAQLADGGIDMKGMNYVEREQIKREANISAMLSLGFQLIEEP